MSASRKSPRSTMDVAAMDIPRRPGGSIRSFIRCISTGGIPSSQRLGIIPWLTLGLVTVFLLVGAFLTFPLALLCAIWGFSVLPLVARGARWTVVVYILLSTMMTVMMLIASLVLAPSGEATQVPMVTMEWTP